MTDRPKKIRANFRKNRAGRPRDRDLTRRFQSNEEMDDEIRAERVSGKGELTRRRTIKTMEGTSDDDAQVPPEVDVEGCETGRVLAVRGLVCDVQTSKGDVWQCATRRLLKTLSTEQRHVVATGDRVIVRHAGSFTGMIERIEPRHGIIARTSKGRQHVMVANVDQMLIVSSAAQPNLTPHLIDRLIVTAEQTRLNPVICLNKVDLCSQAELQPLVGTYGQMGYPIVLTSVVTGQGIEFLRGFLKDRQTAVTGQSGVGKSSLLNALQPGLGLRVRDVSRDNEKGRHTTTTAQLLPLDFGGWVVDTPGIRQFQLWDIAPAEIAGLFRDVRPYVSQCQFPNCTHVHEAACAVKDAVADHRLDLRRYDSYCHMLK